MIQSFADRDTEELFESERNHRFAALSRVALRKLIQMNQAGALRDLAVLCGSRAEIPTYHPRSDFPSHLSVMVVGQFEIHP